MEFPIEIEYNIINEKVVTNACIAGICDTFIVL